MYLYAVQDSNGREVCSATVDPEKVGDVTAELRGGQAVIVQEGEGSVAFGDVVEGGTYTLHRWDADDKLADSVKHPIQ